MCSLERILQYISIEQEQQPQEGGIPPAYWPASGRLEVENLSARYSAVSAKQPVWGEHRTLVFTYTTIFFVYQDGPAVLKDISFRINAGERVGIGERRVSIF